ncbi:Ger(x)C family spore germination protein [Paenibacillus sp. MWE-103]|uniref:Ger(X)C family spore germination protein n=1 Tax=Paenibacillus artemisiicola TaxID=1172618 RepID=A0ABS3W481_9BACL|nr:Ger(x)C family spore germination protein [Paenibacillus artemisiicola]MBO7743113.1 Ger(x)C family spore germination protein [Paenibacillus artemisiicola]
MTNLSGAGRSLLAIIPLTLLLTGCWDRREINDLAIVTAIGLDADPKSKGIVISAQVYIPMQSSMSGGGIGGTGGTQKNSSVVVSAPGMDIADATQKLQEKLSRKLFWGHAKIIIFGEKLARRGISDTIDYLGRHPGPRERTLVFVCEGNASKMISLDPLIESNTSENLREMSVMRTGLYVTLLKLEHKSARSFAIALPWVKTFTTEGKPHQSVFSQGSAIVKGGKMVGRLSDSATRGLMWVTDSIKDGTITTRLVKEDGLVSVALYKSSSELIPSIHNGQWQLKIKASAEGNVVENISKLDMMDVQTINLMQREFEAVIRKRIESALKPLQDQWQADAVGFGKAFHRKYPQALEQAMSRWEEQFADIKVTYDIHVLIARTGFTDKSLSR